MHAAHRPMRVEIDAWHDAATGSLSYLVADAAAGRCAIIDCLLGFDAQTGRTDERCVAHWAGVLEQRKLTLDWILETHVHADRLSGAFALRAAKGGQIGIGAGVREVAKHWGIADAAAASAPQRPCFDRLFADGDVIFVGNLPLGVLATPGHTPACVTYLVADAAFVGDTLFMPYAGTARCDFPGGSARTLYRSIRRILELPPTTRLYCAHDYAPAGGRRALCGSTVAQQRENNVQVHDGVTEDAFVALRERRDRTLAPPALLRTALHFNLRGELPAPAR